MPPLPNATSVLKVRFIGVYGTAVWNVILHSQYTGAPPTEADLSAYGTSLGSAWATNIAPLCVAAVVLNEMDVVDLSTPTSASARITMNHPGTRVGQGITNATALVSSWKINRRYRGGHPRSYWPGGNTSDMADLRDWSATFVTAATNGFTAFRTAMNATSVAGGSSHMVNLSYISNKTQRVTPQIDTITGVTVGPRVDTQRRRLGKEFA